MGIIKNVVCRLFIQPIFEQIFFKISPSKLTGIPRLKGLSGSNFSKNSQNSLNYRVAREDFRFYFKSKLWVGTDKLYSVSRNEFYVSFCSTEYYAVGALLVKIKTNPRERIQLAQQTTIYLFNCEIIISANTA